MKKDCNNTTTYFAEKDRMTKKCTIDCSDCPLYVKNNTYDLGCSAFERRYSVEAIKIVQE